ncbi:Rosmarinate synthase [Nymphaea thermarum]|nr:Rosmarinate synthase [Nymphaea thermarum]
MKINRRSSKLLKPTYHTPTHPPTDALIPLSPFDTVTYQIHVGLLYAYRPPNPSNEVIEQGLRRLLAEYREFTGRLIFDDNGRQCILLNDKGIHLVEATSGSPLGSLMDKPSPCYLDLHPHITGIEKELFQVQLTRFACGSLVVGCTVHHAVVDALCFSHFLIAWGQTVRNGIPVLPLPLHDRSIFIPRNPPHFQFEHSKIEYTAHLRMTKHPELQHTILMERAHFSSEFLAKLKSKASDVNPCDKPYTTFECLTAHLWRKITHVRKLEEKLTTTVRIPVNGRFRMRNPTVPMRYLGNVVLWAWPRSTVKDLLSKPVGHAARLIHDAVARVDDDYFRSFIDFSSSKEKMEELVPSAYGGDVVLSPDLEVSSWLRIPFYDMDFGTNPPHLFVPSYSRVEGFLHIVPSFTVIGDVDTHVGVLHAYTPPNPSNEDIEQGLQWLPSEYRENSSRLLKPSYQTPIHPTTDVSMPSHFRQMLASSMPTDHPTHQTKSSRKGSNGYLRSTESSPTASISMTMATSASFSMTRVCTSSKLADSPLGSSVDKPSAYYLDLHPDITGIEELAQVQLTRFACGSMLVSITTHHAVSVGPAASHFLITWGRTVQDGLPVQPLPLHDCSIFIPRTVLSFSLNIARLSIRPSTKGQAPRGTAHYCDGKGTLPLCISRETQVQGLWKITRVRNLEGELTTKERIAVNGRFKMRKPTVPMSYLGNVVLWAWPRSKVKDLLSKTVGKQLGSYMMEWLKSFIDFSSSKEKMEGLVSSAYGGDVVLSPNLKVSSWLRIPFYDMDCGTNPLTSL